MGRGTGAAGPLPVRVLVTTVIGALAGCDAGGGEAPSVSGENGVEAVRHTRLADYERPDFSVELLIAIGDEDGPPEYLFGDVAGLDVMADGTIAVLDGHAAEVRTFAPDGSFIRRIGRRGEGPGEFSGEASLALVAVAPESFVVPDIMGQSINRYSLAGEVTGLRRFDIQQTYIPEWRAASDGMPVVRISSGGGEVVTRYDLRSDEESLEDTLAVHRPPVEPGEQDGRQPLWQNHLVWSFTEPGVVVAGWMFSPEFTVHAGGAPVRTVSWDDEEQELTPDERNEILRIVIRGMGMDDAEVPEGFGDQFRLPDRLPAMADIEAGEDLVLVQRVRPVEAMDRRVIYTFRAAGFGGRFWDAFSLGGEYLGVLDMGAPADVFDIRGDTIVGVREDDAGVQQVFLARLPSGLRAGASPTESP